MNSAHAQLWNVAQSKYGCCATVKPHLFSRVLGPTRGVSALSYTVFQDRDTEQLKRSAHLTCPVVDGQAGESSPNTDIESGSLPVIVPQPSGWPRFCRKSVPPYYGDNVPHDVL